MLTLCLLLGGIHRAEVLAPRTRFFAKQNTDNAPCAAFLSNIFGGAKILAGCRARSPADKFFSQGAALATRSENFLKKVFRDLSKTLNEQIIVLSPR